MKANNIIEINGSLYNARTGKPLHNSSQGPSPTTHQKTTKTSVKTVDGFARPAQASTRKQMPAIAAPMPKKTLPTTSTKQRPAAPKAHMKAKHSTTLHRSAVALPNLKIEPPKPVQTISTDLESSALKHTNHSRMQRAANTKKSSSIQRFKPAVTAQKNPPVTVEKPKLTSHLKRTHHQKASSPSTAKEQLIQKAVASVVVASSTKGKGKHQRHWLSRYTPAALAFILIAGYLVYLNVPSISMKVAANRAGFAATMPSYKPAGYSLRGPINYSPGQVSVNFASNTDERSFSLKQQPTTWDSTALLENLVVKKSPNYLTYQDSGLTIYIFDGSNAVWVNAGKLYQVEGNNSRLDTDQLLKLATSV